MKESSDTMIERPGEDDVEKKVRGEKQRAAHTVNCFSEPRSQHSGFAHLGKPKRVPCKPTSSRPSPHKLKMSTISESNGLGEKTNVPEQLHINENA